MMSTNMGASVSSSEPLVSIIIRARDDGAFLGKVFEMLKQQTCRNFEVLVSYDVRSKDDTESISAKNGAKILRIEEGEFTYGYSLNLGVRNAKGKYIVVISGHAVPDNDRWLDELIAPLESLSTLGGSFSRQIPQEGAYGYTRRILQADYPTEGLPSPMLFSTVSAAFRKACWEITPFDNGLPGVEDYAWAMQMKAAGFEIAYAPRSVIRHSHREKYSQMAWRACIVAEAYFALGLSRRSLSYFFSRGKAVVSQAAGDLFALLRGEDDLFQFSRAVMYHVATLHGNYKAYFKSRV
jgi:glycosyltransferase involved in cell wall biosynthesis